MRSFATLTRVAVVAATFVGMSMAQVPPTPLIQPQANHTTEVAVPVPAPTAPAAPSTGLSPDEQAIVTPYFPGPQDQKRVAEIRDLLVDRVLLLEAGGHEDDLDKTAALTLLSLSAMAPNKGLALLKALDGIWILPSDYYDQLSDVYASMDRYRAWLGPERFDQLTAQRLYFAQNRQQFLDWRDQQPPSTWRVGEMLMRRPAPAPTTAAVALPPPPPLRVALLVPPAYSREDLLAFPRSSRRGQPGPIFSAGRLPQNPSAPRILLPNINSGRGTAPMARKPVILNSPRF